MTHHHDPIEDQPAKDPRSRPSEEGSVSEPAANPTPPEEDATTAPGVSDTPQTPPKENSAAASDDA